MEERLIFGVYGGVVFTIAIRVTNNLALKPANVPVFFLRFQAKICSQKFSK